MKKIILLLLMLLLIVAGGFAKEILEKSFENIKVIRLKGITNHCVFKRAKGDTVTVHLEYEARESFVSPKAKSGDGVLFLKDGIGGGEENTWTVRVPAGVTIKAVNVSGDFFLRDLVGEISIQTVSGEISADHCKGELSLLSTNGGMDLKDVEGKIVLSGFNSDIEAKNLSGAVAIKTDAGHVEAKNLDGVISIKVSSGDVEIKRAQGIFKVRASSGDIEAKDIVLTGSSIFKVASGDLEVRLSKSAAHDLVMATASGDAVLDYNGNPVTGTFHMTARTSAGEVISPFSFDGEKKTEKWGKQYVIKTFKKGSGRPHIVINASTGTAELKE